MMKKLGVLFKWEIIFFFEIFTFLFISRIFFYFKMLYQMLLTESKIQINLLFRKPLNFSLRLLNSVSYLKIIKCWSSLSKNKNRNYKNKYFSYFVRWILWPNQLTLINLYISARSKPLVANILCFSLWSRKNLIILWLIRIRNDLDKKIFFEYCSWIKAYSIVKHLNMVLDWWESFSFAEHDPCFPRNGTFIWKIEVIYSFAGNFRLQSH